MIHPLSNEEIVEETKSLDKWAATFTKDFRKRFIHLLGYEFRRLPSTLAIQIVFPGL